MSTGATHDADFAPPAHVCPACGLECKRHSVYTRRVKDISLDGPVTLEVRVGNYRCIACQKFFKPEVPFAPKSKRYTTRAVRAATVSIQEDKTTYLALPRRLERDFSCRPSLSTGWAWFQSFAGSIDIEDYLKWACGRFSGQLSVDSISDGGTQMWFATDPLNRDLILGYHRAEHADAESLTAFLTTLRDKYGIQPKLFTSDDAIVFDNTPQKVWPDAPLQLCHFHVIKNAIYNYLRLSLATRLKKYKPVKPPKPQRPDGKPLPKNSRGYMTAEYVYARMKYDKEQKEWAEMHRRRRLFLKSERSLTKPKSVEREEAKALKRWCRRYPALATFRKFVLDFYAIMSSKDAAAADLLRKAFLKRWARTAKKDEHISHIRKQFADDKWFGRLFHFTAFENAHRTTNSTERANRWFRKRQKHHYRSRKEHTIRNMLHADLVYRRGRTPDEPPNRLREKPIEHQQGA